MHWRRPRHLVAIKLHSHPLLPAGGLDLLHAYHVTRASPLARRLPGSRAKYSSAIAPTPRGCNMGTRTETQPPFPVSKTIESDTGLNTSQEQIPNHDLCIKFTLVAPAPPPP